LLTNLSFKAGTGELQFSEVSDDPIARLKVRKVQSVLFGTLDDFYPETIQVIK
jgi:hypothetical protein